MSDIYLKRWNIAFICGSFACYLLHAGYVKPWTAFAGLLLVLTCTIHPKATVYFAPAGVALILVFFVQRDKERRSKGEPSLVAGALETLGNWSYAIYLTHVPIFLILFPIFKAQGHSPLSAWFCGIGVAMLTGSILGQFDMALYRILKQKINAFFSDKQLIAVPAVN